MAVLAQDLRDALLQAAISGKLTEQLDSDSSVEELLIKIKAEKEQLIKDKKIKKEKSLSEIAEEDVPFEVPSTWKFVNLKTVSYTNGGYAFKSTDYTSEGIRVIRISDFNNNGILDEEIVRYSYNQVLESFKIKQNDILMCMTGGTVGKCCIVDKITEDMATNQRVANISSLGINAKFLYLTIKSPFIQKIIQNNKTSTNDNISMDLILSFPIPLPPLEEQARIVAKVEEIMSKIDEYEKIENQLESIKKAFPMDMHDALLQAAMQGKLTEQLDSDSSVDDLIESIKVEREKLVAEGKIKKSKGKSTQYNVNFVELPKDEYPYDIPKNWKMLKLENILTLDKGEKLSGTKYNYLEAKYLRTLANPTIKDSGEFVKKDTYTILVDGENSGEVFKIPEDGYMGSTYKVLNMSSELNIDFILYFLKHHRKYLRDNKKGSAIPHLNKTIFYGLSFPIPPIEEQQRIVETLDRLLPLCEAL